MSKQRARVYSDGYNFYYGALKGTGFKWLDPVALADALLPNLEIEVVKYFTARIAGNPWNSTDRARQAAYLDALAALPRLECIEGYYRERIKQKSLINPRDFGLPKADSKPFPRVNVLDQEENSRAFHAIHPVAGRGAWLTAAPPRPIRKPVCRARQAFKEYGPIL